MTGEQYFLDPQKPWTEATWLADAVSNVRFSSSRLWKNHPPDKFDFIYTRLLFHTGELCKRFSETTAYDVLAGIELPSQHDIDHLQDTHINLKEDLPKENLNVYLQTEEPVISSIEDKEVSQNNIKLKYM
jgi:hypothetical protein